MIYSTVGHNIYTFKIKFLHLFYTYVDTDITKKIKSIQTQYREEKEDLLLESAISCLENVGGKEKPKDFDHVFAQFVA